MASGARYSGWRTGPVAKGVARASPSLRIAALMAAVAALLFPLASAPVMAQARLAVGMRGPVGRPAAPGLPDASVGTQVAESRPGAAEALAQPVAPVAAVQYEAVPATADAVIEQMSEAAGAIFAGQVVAVRRPAGFMGSAEDAAEGVVETDFRVVKALRGPRQGSVYTLREWSGLWAGNAERFRVGRQLLLFLRSPDASGLSSPVHGADGAIPLRGGGVAPGPEDTTVAAAEWLVDLRWVQARTLRQPSWKTEPVREPVRRGGAQPYAQPYAQSHGSDERYEQSALVRAIPRPGLPPAASDGEAEPLSQVLQLCLNAMRTPHVPVR